MTRSDQARASVGRRMPEHVGVRDDVVHLLLAGLGNSSPGHWQRSWAELLPSAVWLEHSSWDAPDEQAWLADLEAFLAQEQRPVVAVTHSLGCSLLAAWATRHLGESGESSPVVAAFLVAPPDVERPDFPPEVTGFDSIDYAPLPFPATVVYSADDPYCTTERALVIGERLGAELVEVGALGHINSGQVLGDWPQGQDLFRQLLQHVDTRLDGAGR